MSPFSLIKNLVQQRSKACVSLVLVFVFSAFVMYITVAGFDYYVLSTVRIDNTSDFLHYCLSMASVFQTVLGRCILLISNSVCYCVVFQSVRRAGYSVLLAVVTTYSMCNV